MNWATRAIAPVLAASLLPAGASAAAPATPAAASTVCALKGAKLKPKALPAPRTMSITALFVYNAEYGYFLQEPTWPTCEDKVDGSGMIRVEFPAGKTLKDFSPLKKAMSPEGMKANKGKRIYCTCEGEVSFSESGPAFLLSRVDKVWAGN
jgi:hypothetical protein